MPLADFGLGGTERIAIRLANAWAGEGRAVTLFCGQDQGALAPLIDRARVEVVVADPPIPRGPRSRHRLGRAAARHARIVGFDACFVPGNYHWPAIRALDRLPGAIRPRIVAQVSAALIKPQRRALRRLLFERGLRRRLAGADAVVTLSERTRAEFRRLAPALPCLTIPLPALEDDEPPPVRAAGATILAAGRLVPEKGFADLIRAFALLDDPALRLRIVGAGPEEAALRALAVEQRVDGRVDLPGYAEDVRPFLRDARLFVLASHFEGYAAVIVEALAAGLPVVATDCTPAIEDLITEPETGFAVPIADPAALAAAIEAMLAQPAPDPERLAAKVAAYRIGPVARDYLALFANLPRRR